MLTFLPPLGFFQQCIYTFQFRRACPFSRKLREARQCGVVGTPRPLNFGRKGCPWRPNSAYFLTVLFQTSRFVEVFSSLKVHSVRDHVGLVVCMRTCLLDCKTQGVPYILVSVQRAWVLKAWLPACDTLGMWWSK